MAYNPWLDGLITRTTISGDDGTGTYRPAVVDANGALLVASSDNDFEVQLRSEGTENVAVPSHIIQVGGKGEFDGALHALMVDDDDNLHVTARTGLPDPNNTFSGQLAAGETWTGTWTDAEEFPFVSFSMKATVPSAENGVIIQFSGNGVDVGCEFKFTYDTTLVGTGRSFMMTRRGRYVRLKYINGSTPDDINIFVILQKAGAVGEVMVVDTPVDQHDIAVLTKSVIAGKSVKEPDGYRDVRILDHDGLGNYDTPALAVRSIPDQYQLSAFNELRVSIPRRLVDIIQKYGRDTRHIGTLTSGGGLVTDAYNMSGFKLSVGATNGDYAKARTSQWYRYQTGRGQQIILTVIHSDTGQANQVRNWGYYDDNDGLMYRLNGTTLSVVRRTSTGESGGALGTPYEEVVPQANWNVDPLNGLGPSGHLLDVTKGSIYEIRFQWLGVGVVSFYVNTHLVHRMVHPNLLPYPYMRTATLPLTWEIINNGASTASHFFAICGHVTSESGETPPEEIWSAVAAPKNTAGAVEVPLLSLRLKSTFNTVDNRINVIPRLLSMSETGARNAYVYLRLNPTLTNPSWTSVDTNSGSEYDVSATATTGGQLLARYSLPASSTRDLEIGIFDLVGRTIRRDAFSGVSDIFSVNIQRATVVDAIVDCALNWGEFK